MICEQCGPIKHIMVAAWGPRESCTTCKKWNGCWEKSSHGPRTWMDYLLPITWSRPAVACKNLAYFPVELYCRSGSMGRWRPCRINVYELIMAQAARKRSHLCMLPIPYYLYDVLTWAYQINNGLRYNAPVLAHISLASRIAAEKKACIGHGSKCTAPFQWAEAGQLLPVTLPKGSYWPNQLFFNDTHMWAHKTLFSMLLKHIWGNFSSLTKFYSMTSNSSPW